MEARKKAEVKVRLKDRSLKDLASDVRSDALGINMVEHIVLRGHTISSTRIQKRLLAIAKELDRRAKTTSTDGE